MENQNSPKIRLKNYQIIQRNKERKLDRKNASLKQSLESNRNKITELENQLAALATEKVQALASIAKIDDSRSKDIKDARLKLSTLEKELENANKSLSSSNEELQAILDAKQKEMQDSPRALEVKGRLAYLNAEIKDNSAKIEEYKKEAKRELFLATQIEKLKKQEETLKTVLATGETSLKHNYQEELDVAQKERAGYEKQLEDFRKAEDVEIRRLSDINAEMSIEVGELTKELSVLRASQDNASAAMQRVEADKEVIALRKKIETANQQVATYSQSITELNAKTEEIKQKELEAARQNGKEQEYLAKLNEAESLEKRVKEIDVKVASSEKEIENLKNQNVKNEAKLKEVEAGILECSNYNTWVANNKRFSEEMYPVAMENAARDIRIDRENATHNVRHQLEKEAEVVLKEEIERCRTKAAEVVDSKRVPAKGVVRDTAIALVAKDLIERRIKKYIEEVSRTGASEVWNKEFRKIRDQRLAAIEKELAQAKQKLDKNPSEENQREFDEATKAKEMFSRVETDNTLLVIKNLRKYFPVEKSFFGRPTRYLKAVDDVSLRVQRGKTLGIVGESGCGKTTMGRTVLRLHEITDGQIIFDGHHLESLTNREMRSLRTDLQIIFQDPYSSLSPRLPIGEIIGEAVKAHKLVPNSEYKDYIMGVMKSCGLQPHHFSRFPHEFSGGQRQRICIARALAVNPKVVICDEPVSALDVSIQAQIINLLKDLQQTRNLTYIFISHDLSVVEHISDDVGVMYLGSMVESGPKEKIFDNPMHPYTEALLSAVPVPDPNVKMNRIFLKGDIPSPSRPPRGCKFHTRCHKCMDVCKTMPPVYREYEKDHFVACHLYPQD